MSTLLSLLDFLIYFKTSIWNLFFSKSSFSWGLIYVSPVLTNFVFSCFLLLHCHLRETEWSRTEHGWGVWIVLASQLALSLSWVRPTHFSEWRYFHHRTGLMTAIFLGCLFVSFVYSLACAVCHSLVQNGCWIVPRLSTEPALVCEKEYGLHSSDPYSLVGSVDIKQVVTRVTTV